MERACQPVKAKGVPRQKEGEEESLKQLKNNQLRYKVNRDPAGHGPARTARQEKNSSTKNKQGDERSGLGNNCRGGRVAKKTPSAKHRKGKKNQTLQP